jgi:hypothetical protein
MERGASEEGGSLPRASDESCIIRNMLIAERHEPEALYIHVCAQSSSWRHQFVKRLGEEEENEKFAATPQHAPIRCWLNRAAESRREKKQELELGGN